MSAIETPWDAIELLEEHASDPAFEARWRQFLASTEKLLLPQLPSEALEWSAASDSFDKGGLSKEEIEAVRVSAWRFLDAHKPHSTETVLNGLHAVMWRLWPPDSRTDWYESAWHFLQYCSDAGLGEASLLSLLMDAFGEWLPESVSEKEK
jgi:hypothetical protein